MISTCLGVSTRWIRLDSSIRHSPDLPPVWVDDISLSTHEVDVLDSIYVSLLHGSVWEDAFFLSVGVDAFHGSIREGDFLGAVWKMLLNLSIWEFELLDIVRVAGLDGLSFSEVVNHDSVRQGLFDIGVSEVDDSSAVGVDFLANTVREGDFLATTGVGLLHFPVRSGVGGDEFGGVRRERQQSYVLTMHIMY